MIPPNRLYGPKDFFAGPFLICGDGGEDLISLTDSQITKYEKKYHSPLIFLELYPKPITLKCTPELYAKLMGEEHQHDTQENLLCCYEHTVLCLPSLLSLHQYNVRIVYHAFQ